MRHLAEKLFTASALILSLGMVAACGSSTTTSSSTPAPAANNTPAPQPTNSYPSHQLAVGDTVGYIGPRSSGSTFSNPNIAYTGTVKQINQHILVTWNNGIGDVAVTSTVIVPRVVFNPDLTGHSVEYIGAQSASTPNFTDPNHVYFGTVVAQYSLGYIEVLWNDFNYDTIEPAANLSIAQ